MERLIHTEMKPLPEMSETKVPKTIILTKISKTSSASNIQVVYMLGIPHSSTLFITEDLSWHTTKVYMTRSRGQRYLKLWFILGVRNCDTHR